MCESEKREEWVCMGYEVGCDGADPQDTRAARVAWYLCMIRKYKLNEGAWLSFRCYDVAFTDSLKLSEISLGRSLSNFDLLHNYISIYDCQCQRRLGVNGL